MSMVRQIRARDYENEVDRAIKYEPVKNVLYAIRRLMAMRYPIF